MPEPVDPDHQKIIRNHLATTIAISMIAAGLLRYSTERTKFRTGELAADAK